MFISPRSGARAVQRLPSLKCYNVLQWETRFTLRLYAARSNEDIKNASNKNCSELNLLRKSQQTYIFISLISGTRCRRLQRLPLLKYYNQEQEMIVEALVYVTH